MKKLVIFLFLLMPLISNIYGQNSAAAAQNSAHSQNGAYVKSLENWNHENLHDFLKNTPYKDVVELAVALELIDQEELDKLGTWGVIWEYDKINGVKTIITDIEKKIIWLSSNISTYYFRSNKVDYHNLVKWAASEKGIDKEIIENEATFIIELAILEKMFADTWDKLTEEQRREIVNNLAKNNELTSQQKKGLIAASGTVAMGTLAGTVFFSGFAFYTTMSTVMAGAAGLLGVTLPFAAYAGASTVVGILSGPIGWSIIGAGAIGSTILAGGANEEKTISTIIAIHLLKAQALKNSRYIVPSIPMKYRWNKELLDVRLKNTRFNYVHHEFKSGWVYNDYPGVSITPDCHPSRQFCLKGDWEVTVTFSNWPAQPKSVTWKIKDWKEYETKKFISSDWESFKSGRLKSIYLDLESKSLNYKKRIYLK